MKEKIKKKWNLLKKYMKILIKKIIKYINKQLKKFIRWLNKDKNKYYWKRKYYRLLRDVNKEKTRNDTLAIDLRKTYAQKKRYQNLYHTICIMLNMVVEKGNDENSNT